MNFARPILLAWATVCTVFASAERSCGAAAGDSSQAVSVPVVTVPRLGPMEELDGPVVPLDERAVGALPEGAMTIDPKGADSGEIVSLADDYGSLSSDQIFSWQLMPQGLIYRPYMAGAKESRFHGGWMHDHGEGDIWDVGLGGQVGILRYGTRGDARPEGIQLSMEGAGQTRLDPEEELDVVATDYRFGIPITWGDSFHQVKFAFYHLSSHVADEYLELHPGFTRLNYSRNVLVLGHSIYPTPKSRFYAEAGYGVDVDVSQPWEFQFGFDYGPSGRTGARGEPFFAFNGHLREEVDFGGNVVAQVGWAWRRSPASGMLRTGLEYYNGKSDQFSFFNDSEQKLGYSIWYDY
jgi:hypothetical protein